LSSIRKASSKRFPRFTGRRGTQISGRVSITDKVGDKRDEVIFPFAFVSGLQGRDELPASFREEDVSTIDCIAMDLKP